MRQVAVITQREKECPVFRALHAPLFRDSDEIIVFDELEKGRPGTAFPVNRTLFAQYAVLAATEGFERIVCTCHAGAPYFLLQEDPDHVTLVAHDLLVRHKPFGAILSEYEISRIELEETVVRDFRDRIAFASASERIYLDHFYGTEVALGPTGADCPFPTTTGKRPLIFLPEPQQTNFSDPDQTHFEPLGLRLSHEEYLAWVQAGTAPKALEDVDLGGYLLVDQGNDYLGLSGSLSASGTIGGTILAIDQKRPADVTHDGQIRGFNEPGYLRSLLHAHRDGGFDRFPGFGDIAPFCDRIGPVGAARPRVSVIVVTHNRPELLRQCLAGFRQQTEQRFEIIVIDNGSQAVPDLADFADLDLMLIRNLNAYPGHARNLGGEVARAEHVLFFDDDNIPKPNMLERMLAAASDDPNDIISCFREMFLTVPGDIGDLVMSAPSLTKTSMLRNFQGDVVLLIKRSRFLEIRFTDYFRVGREDFEFVYFAQHIGCRVRTLPEVLYHYRAGNTDKIGHRHLTHRTGMNAVLDFGSFRKHRRSAGSHSAARLRQIFENYHVREAVQTAPFLVRAARRLLPDSARRAIRKKISSHSQLRRLYYRLRLR